jgi:hypothetical protein
MTKYLVLFLIIAAGYLLLTGSEEIPKGFTSPDAIGEHVVSALNAKDSDKALQVFVPRAILEEAMDCAGINPWVSDSNDDRVEVNALLRFRWRKPSQPIEFLGHEVTKTEEFLSGDNIQGCTAKTAITRWIVRMKGRHYFYGGKTESEMGANLIQIGSTGEWWVLKR